MATFLKWIDCDHQSVRMEGHGTVIVKDYMVTPSASGSIRLKNNTELTFTTPLNSDERALLDQLMQSIAARIQDELLPS